MTPWSMFAEVCWREASRLPGLPPGAWAVRELRAAWALPEVPAAQAAWALPEVPAVQAAWALPGAQVVWVVQVAWGDLVTHAAGEFLKVEPAVQASLKSVLEAQESVIVERAASVLRAALEVVVSSRAELAVRECVTEALAVWVVLEVRAASVLRAALVAEECVKAVQTAWADLEVQSVLVVPGIWEAWELRAALPGAALWAALPEAAFWAVPPEATRCEVLAVGVLPEDPAEAGPEGVSRHQLGPTLAVSQAEEGAALLPLRIPGLPGRRREGGEHLAGDPP